MALQLAEKFAVSFSVKKGTGAVATGSAACAAHVNKIAEIIIAFFLMIFMIDAFQGY